VSYGGDGPKPEFTRRVFYLPATEHDLGLVRPVPGLEERDQLRRGAIDPVQHDGIGDDAIGELVIGDIDRSGNYERGEEAK
jgi:hypothetical protein